MVLTDVVKLQNLFYLFIYLLFEAKTSQKNTPKIKQKKEKKSLYFQ